MLNVGDYGKDFVLSCHDGGMTRLSRVQSRNDYLVVFFFLAAGSPGCTREVNGFRDLYGEFQKRRVSIIGISPDPVSALADFAKQNNIPFDLCSDMDHSTAQQWGTWNEGGQMRSTFILNDKGLVARVFPRANVYTHAQDVLVALDALIMADGGTVPGPATGSTEATAAPMPTQAAPPAATSPAPASAPTQAAPPAATSPAVTPAPTAGGALGAGDVVCALARTCLQLLIQHVESGGPLPADVAELAGRLALLRYK